MNYLRHWQSSLLITASMVGCSSEELAESQHVAVTQSALSPCDETVPANRNIDGIPAYAQCASIQDGPIFSNNGVDTSATKTASDWVQTQYSGGYQCTELAHRYLYFKWKVKWIPNGNAGEWCNTTPPANSGIVQTMTPVHGDIMVLAPGSCGAGAETGHVNVIDVVDTAKSKVIAVEQNMANRGTYNQSCGKCFLHVVANDGTTAPAATAGSDAKVPAAGTGAFAPPPPAAGTVGRPAPAGGAGAVGAAGSAAPTKPIPSGPSMIPTAGTAAPGVGSPQPTAAGSGVVVATAGSAAPVVRSRGNAPEASGCSVQGAGASDANAYWFGALGLVLVGSRVRRRVKRA